MSDPGEFRRLLLLMKEPVLVLDPSGRILEANPAASRLVGADAAHQDLTARVEDPAALRTYLSRAAGTSEEIPGGLVLVCPAGDRHRLRASAGLLTPAGEAGPARILLRLRSQGPEEFSILRRSIQDLNREIRLRQRALVELEAAVHHRDTLLAELQHRIKNTTQMLLGMIAAAQRGAASAETKDLLQSLRSRLLAMGAAQQLMYRLGKLDGIEAAEFLPALCQAIEASWPDAARLELHVDPVKLRNDVAVPLALIVNELATNALKHGLRFGAGRVAVELRCGEDALVLTVVDSGSGLDRAAVLTADEQATERGHGLPLVRALCRQIGGSLVLEPGDGAVWQLRLPPNSEAR